MCVSVILISDSCVFAILIFDSCVFAILISVFLICVCLHFVLQPNDMWDVLPPINALLFIGMLASEPNT